MSNMMTAISPKSDQLNADDLPAGVSKTIRISKVTIRPGAEQPVSISFEGDNGKPWKPCKSMCRVLVNCWGADANQYVGRLVTLYCDPAVRWGGMEVGGIRISHLSHIASPTRIALTVTRGKKAPFVVDPMEDRPAPAPPARQASNTDDNDPATEELLAEFDNAIASHGWGDGQKNEMLITISNGRQKRGQSAVTRWNQVTRGQIRWAIGQVK